MEHISAARLVLEPLTAAHADAMFALLSDPALYRFVDEPPPESADALRERYARLESRTSPDGTQAWLNWVVRASGGEAVGYVQATVVPPTAWVAFMFARRHQGRGYATVATRAVIEQVGAAYRVERWLASVEAANARSIALLERLGFRLATPAEAAPHALSETERLYLRP